MKDLGQFRTRIWDNTLKDFRVVWVRIEIDPDALAHEYGQRAHANKSAQVRECKGAIRIHAIRDPGNAPR